MAKHLRTRLYELCEAAQRSHNKSNWLCPRKPLKREEGYRMLGRSTFCFIPVGDAPGRVTLFDALPRGCVPVFFSSCAQNSNLQAFSAYLPADPIVRSEEPETMPPAGSRAGFFAGFYSTLGASIWHMLTKLFGGDGLKPTASVNAGLQFGRRRWSVLLNQTAVMTSDTYLVDELSKITPEQIKEMRDTVTEAVAKRLHFSVKESKTDALAVVIEHMLRKGKGMPTDGPTIPEDFIEYYPDEHYT
jgi:hypothetical protein